MKRKLSHIVLIVAISMGCIFSTVGCGEHACDGCGNCIGGCLGTVCNGCGSVCMGCTDAIGDGSSSSSSQGN